MSISAVPDEYAAPEHRSPALWRLARPKQWVKNVLVIAAPGAAGVLTEGDALFKTGVAFVCFCLAASATYYFNDAIDVEADRRHPRKRFRPVAAGEVSRETAFIGGGVLAVAALALSFAARWQLVLVIGGYFVLTIAYSLWLKHEPVLDLAAVACGFVLRAIAGGIAVGVPISPWFLIVAGAGSMFMVTGKRSAELHQLGVGSHRRALAGYTEAFLAYVRGVASSVLGRLRGWELTTSAEGIIGQARCGCEIRSRVSPSCSSATYSSRWSRLPSEPPNCTFEKPKRSRRRSVVRARRSSFSRRPGSSRSSCAAPEENAESSTPTRRNISIPFHACSKSSRIVRRNISSRSDGSPSV